MAELKMPTKAHKQIGKNTKWHLAKHVDTVYNITTTCNKILWAQPIGIEHIQIKNLESDKLCAICWPYGVE